MIAVNSRLPEGNLQQRVNNETITHNVQALFADKTVVLFAVPGAFTPTCSVAHLPGYVVQADEFKAKGVDAIICLAVNDAFVMEAWGKSQNAENLMMLADGDGSFTTALGLEIATGGFGGLRSKRYAMVVKNGVVSQLHIEKPKEFEVSKAENVLATL